MKDILREIRLKASFIFKSSTPIGNSLAPYPRVAHIKGMLICARVVSVPFILLNYVDSDRIITD